VGGIAAQEMLNAVSAKEVHIDGWYCFSTSHGQGACVAA
jgi:hypothetical protein